MPRPSRYLALAQAIDAERAATCSARFAAHLPKGSPAHAIATLLGAAYPALAGVLDAAPEIARRLDEEGFVAARSSADLLARMLAKIGDLADEGQVQRELRRTARDERIRIALRELLPPSLGGADVDVTARELSDLASATIEVALAEAVHAVSQRFGTAQTATGTLARFTVLGMGKLGGDELNAGSDVDLVFFYDTDDGGVVPPDQADAISLHEYWTRVARRLTATLEEPTADGFVWRVDLRLRPEGRSGPLVNSLAAAERYYESFGRLWERAALLRARPIAGDRAFGDEVLATLSPFVWRRRVDPKVAAEMIGLAQRSRAELGAAAERDLKLGPGGIREAEFFVQALQLVWGGKEPRVRARNTLDGLRRLRAEGFVTDREAREVTEAYLALRRAEHAVQVATGLQTHARPEAPDALARLSRALGFDGPNAFTADIAKHIQRVSARFLSLSPDRVALPEVAKARFSPAIAALERADAEAFVDGVMRAAKGPLPEPDERLTDAARDLFELSRHPDAPLGGRTREQFDLLAEAVLGAVIDAADPEQAARYLRVFFARVTRPGVYVKLLGDDTRAVRRLVEALGASAFIGDALANNPELGDVILFARGAPTPEMARSEVEMAVETAGRAADDEVEDDDEPIVEALRRAKARVTLQVGLADIASQLDTRQATATLSALADAELEAATRHALGSPGGARGLVVLAMGKLGGHEIGYGSDLDVLFLYHPLAAPAGSDASAWFARCTRRIIRLISVSHGAGPGYELDTRLRPSGSQGLLVTSLDAFARYHGIGEGADAPQVRAAAWERLALLRARPAAGDPVLGAEALRVAHAAAYDMPRDPAGVAEEIHRLRTRLLRENSQERRGRYDIKLGRGGLVDIEFAVQLLQLEHGADLRVRTTETAVAIDALASAGYLAPEHAETLRDGYAFLRKLEQRIRILHDTPSNLLEENAPGLSPLARRMGIRDRRGSEAAAELLARYRDVTERVHAAYEAIVTRRGGT
jgi:glutamate-ammonia-ligase adenylyltransferase